MIARRSLLGGAALLAAGPIVASSAVVQAHAIEEINLWPGIPPGKGGATGPEKVGGEGTGFGAVSNISTPRMRVYRPNHANGRAVLVLGGGGYFRIQLWKESTPIAQWLQLRGYTVFELIYRLPNDGWEATAPFADAQRAIKIIRTRAADFSIRADQIGIMGFSAGGHLAGFTALQPDRPLYEGSDQFENASARPDFSVLLFPVVTLRKPYDTTRTRREIVGENPTSAADDATTPPFHGIAMFQALVAKGAPAELHIFEEGGHGWGLGTADQILNQWPEIFENWVTRRSKN